MTSDYQNCRLHLEFRSGPFSLFASITRTPPQQCAFMYVSLSYYAMFIEFHNSFDELG